MDSDYFDLIGEIYNTSFPTFDAASGIQMYVSPVLLVVGSISNLVLLPLMIKMASTVSSTCVYVAVLVCLEVAILWIRDGNQWFVLLIQRNPLEEIMTSSDILCKAMLSFTSFIIHFSRWLLVAMAVESAISFVFPDRADSVLKLSYAKSIILLQLVVFITVNMHYFWWFELVVPKKMANVTDELQLSEAVCTYNQKQYNEIFANIIFPRLELIVIDIFPLIIIFCCTVAMFTQIIRKRHRGSLKHQAWSKRYLLDPEAIEQLKISFCVICTLYILLIGPNSIRLMSATKESTEEDMLSLEHFRRMANDELTRTLCNMLLYTFMSCKLLVFLAVSSRVRQELLHFFRRLNRRLKVKKVMKNKMVALQQACLVDTLEEEPASM